MYHSPLEYLLHIRDECEFIVSATNNKSRQELIQDPVLSRAVIRSLEIIGEATKKINPDFTKQYPQVLWKNMAGMRDRLIHNYMEIDEEVVCDSVFIDVPELLQHLPQMIASFKK